MSNETFSVSIGQKISHYVNAKDTDIIYIYTYKKQFNLPLTTLVTINEVNIFSKFILIN